MKPILLVLFLLFPFSSYAALYTLPSGMIYEIPDPILKWFTLPSGLQILAEVHVSELSLEEQIERFIYGMADKYGLDRGGLKKLAVCESNLNPKAFNPKDVDGRPKYGLFQYDKRTFVGEDIWDWKEQTEQTAEWLSRGYWKKWPVCIRVRARELMK